MLSKLRSNKKGFTLIELMIVVAIIGILAALAIPNFLKFQAKSKTSEAKTNLKGIYTAQASYYGEFGSFSTFPVINWIPVGKTLIYGYSIDGNITGVQTVNQPIMSNAAGTMYAPSVALTNGQAWVAVGNYAFLGTMTPVLDNQFFIAGAAGQVAPRVPRSDCWVINDNNNLINTQDGV